MVPRIAARGHSFKGAGMYYLHDKEALTTERVAWTETRNLPTNDPEVATKFMAYTAINANKIKQEAGIPLTGRKRKRGVVYTFSLSWSPEEKPEREVMVISADQTIKKLGLQDHQSLIVAHNDTDHPHVHVICNLINPNTGRMNDPDWGSKLKMSEWSQKHEMENGKIYCEQRVINNEKRKRGERVNYEEPLHERKAEIQELYKQSDNGASFRAALEEKGYSLAKGNRRRFVLVDDYGKIHNLSRQLDKDQRQNYLDKLSDLTHQELPIAQELAEERKYFDRDKQEREQLQRIEDAAIEKAEAEKETQKQQKDDHQKQEDKNQTSDLPEAVHKRFDRLKKWEETVDRKRAELKEKIAKTYERDMHANRISDLENQIAANDNLVGKVSGKLKKLQAELEAEKLTLKNIDERIAEQTNSLEKEIAESKPADYWDAGNKKEMTPEKDNKAKDSVVDLEEERKRREIEEQRNRLRQKQRQKPKDRDKGFDIG